MEKQKSKEAEKQGKENKQTSKKQKFRTAKKQRAEKQGKKTEKHGHRNPTKKCPKRKATNAQEGNTYCFFKSSLMKFGRDLGTSLGIRVLAIVVVAAFLVVDLSLLHLTHDNSAHDAKRRTTKGNYINITHKTIYFSTYPGRQC